MVPVGTHGTQGRAEAGHRSASRGQMYPQPPSKHVEEDEDRRLETNEEESLQEHVSVIRYSLAEILETLERVFAQCY